MFNIIIEKEFQELLPPLDQGTYRALEENILANGCLFPLVTWKDILIDGHNRYAICTEHKVPFKIIEKEFASREDVIVWIISNQVARRNLSATQLSYFRGLHYNTVKGKGGNPKGVNQYSEVGSKNPTQPQTLKTADFLSKQYKVHRDTIYNDAKSATSIDAIGKVSPTAKAMILAGDVSIEKNTLKKLSSASEDEIAEVAAKIEEGIYRKAEFDTSAVSEPNPPDYQKHKKDITTPLPTNMLDATMKNFTQSILKLDNKQQHIINEWLGIWRNYIDIESSFDPRRLVYYRRGDVVLAHFGYNVGNELGGIHYAVVVEGNNNPASGIVTVVPISSLEVGKTIGSLIDNVDCYAMPSQMRPISKMRIIKPKYKSHRKIKIRNEFLDLIDEQIINIW